MFPNHSNDRLRLMRSLYLHSTQPLLYVSNAKVACSTFKKSIWQSTSPESFDKTSKPHDRIRGPFVPNLRQIAQNNMARLREASIFTVVRNPYSRFLSAYQDKILRDPRDPHVWKALQTRYGFKGSARPSIQKILHCLRADDPHFVDQHFSPQALNLSWGAIDYDFVGHLENMQPTADFLAGHGITIHSFTKHQTGAENKVQEALAPADVTLIQQLFEEDFEIFGYDLDPGQLAPKAALTPPKVDRRLLKLIIELSQSKSRTTFNQCEEKLLALSDRHDTTLMRLELGFATRGELTTYVEAAKTGKMSDWKTLSLLAQRLIEQELLPSASEILQLAQDRHPISV